MPAAITPKFQRYNKVTIKDGAALAYILTQWEGVFSYTDPEPAALVSYDGNEFSAVVAGQKQAVSLSFTVNLTAFTLAGGTDGTNLQNQILDVLKTREGWAGATNAAPASFTNFKMFDLEFELPLGLVHGETANPVKTFLRCRYASSAMSAGDPNTQVITMECYGGTTDAGQTEP